tara:strand:- start:344 stop:631 length:288 start_codon:yes stop_codon:yes gene_type:complete
MDKNIIEAHCIFENGKLTKVFTLWEDIGDWNGEGMPVRATCTGGPDGSAYSLAIIANDPSPTVTQELLQKVANMGMYCNDDEKEKYFPGERQWTR